MDIHFMLDTQGRKRKRSDFPDEDLSPTPRFQYSEFEMEKPRATNSAGLYRDFSTLWEALDSDEDETESTWYSPHQKKLLSDLMASLEREIGESSQTSSLTCTVQNKWGLETLGSINSLCGLNSSRELYRSNNIDLDIVDYYLRDDAPPRHTIQEYFPTSDSHSSDSAIELLADYYIASSGEGECVAALGDF
eukprot:c8617_g1_i1 orf=117-692(-)